MDSGTMSPNWMDAFGQSPVGPVSQSPQQYTQSAMPFAGALDSTNWNKAANDTAQNAYKSYHDTVSQANDQYLNSVNNQYQAPQMKFGTKDLIAVVLSGLLGGAKGLEGYAQGRMAAQQQAEQDARDQWTRQNAMANLQREMATSLAGSDLEGALNQSRSQQDMANQIARANQSAAANQSKVDAAKLGADAKSEQYLLQLMRSDTPSARAAGYRGLTQLFPDKYKYDPNVDAQLTANSPKNMAELGTANQRNAQAALAKTKATWIPKLDAAKISDMQSHTQLLKANMALANATTNLKNQTTQWYGKEAQSRIDAREAEAKRANIAIAQRWAEINIRQQTANSPHSAKDTPTAAQIAKAQNDADKASSQAEFYGQMKRYYAGQAKQNPNGVTGDGKTTFSEAAQMYSALEAKQSQIAASGKKQVQFLKSYPKAVAPTRGAGNQ